MAHSAVVHMGINRKVIGWDDLQHSRVKVVIIHECTFSSEKYGTSILRSRGAIGAIRCYRTIKMRSAGLGEHRRTVPLCSVPLCSTSLRLTVPLCFIVPLCSTGLPQ
jgi:hypothetical protein